MVRTSLLAALDGSGRRILAMLLVGLLASAGIAESNHLSWRAAGTVHASGGSTSTSPLQRGTATMVRLVGFHEEMVAGGGESAGHATLQGIIVRRPGPPPNLRFAQRDGEDSELEQELIRPFDEDLPPMEDSLDVGPSLEEELMSVPDAPELPMEEDADPLDVTGPLDAPLLPPTDDPRSLPPPADDLDRFDPFVEDDMNQLMPDDQDEQSPSLRDPTSRARDEDEPDDRRRRDRRSRGSLKLEEERQATEQLCQEELGELKQSTLADVELSIAVDGTEGEDYPFECMVDDGTPHERRCWPQVTYMWKASALCHKPLYFEEVELERYGHSWGPCLQPIVSGAHFFCRLPVLPYCMGYTPPCECQYALGYYRPGSCAPYTIPAVPISLRGALFQAGATVGTAVIVP